MSYNWNIDEFELIGDWYIGPIEGWTEPWYGKALRSGRDDLVYNNCRIIIEGDIEHEQAIDIHVQCEVLLTERKRWPDHMNDPEQCNTRFCSWVNKMKFRYYKNRGRVARVKRRSQGDLTKDPWVLFVACGVHLGFTVKTFYVKYPWYIWRPNFGAWMRCVQNPTKLNVWRWEMAEAASALFSTEKEFTNILYQYRVKTINQLTL